MCIRDRGVTGEMQNNPEKGLNSKTSVFAQMNTMMNELAKLEIGKSKSEMQSKVDEVLKKGSAIAKSLGFDDEATENLKKYVKEEFSQKLKALKEEADKQKQKEKEKEEEKRQDRRGAYEPNTILKTQVDVRFPFGDGRATADVKNGYLSYT